jgi:hypothetical protein
MPNKITADHDLVKAKINAGLPPADALEVAQRQLDHDAALAAAEEAAAKAKAAADKAAGKKGDKADAK